MKKIFLLAIGIIFSLVSTAQNVGVGTNTPQAPLHIRSMTSSEVLRAEGLNPYIALYDVAEGYRGFFWYDGTTVVLGTSGVSNLPLTISPALNFNTIFLPNGNVGIGNLSPMHKLDVLGGVNMTGPLNINGNPGTPGQVLVSNGSAAPAWMPITANQNIAFSGYLSAFTPVPNATLVNLDTYSQLYDDGGDNFNPATGIFTVPVSGLYHFDIVIAWNMPSVRANTFVRLTVNGFDCIGCQMQSLMEVGASFSQTFTMTVNQKLFAGDAVHLSLHQSSTATLTLLGGSSRVTTVFSGYKVN